jgi:hypothetical protein
MADKKRDKEDLELLGGAEPVLLDNEPTPEAQAASDQHQILTENIEAHRCPYHGQDLKIQREKRMVKKLDENDFETNQLREITVRFAVCTCVTPGRSNPYRGRRVWEQT